MEINLKLVPLILILFFISVSVVSANDTIDEIGLSDVDNDETIQNNINNDMGNDILNNPTTEPKGFDDLQKEIWTTPSGSIIELDSDYVYDGYPEHQGREFISIDRTITLDGKGHTLDGKNNAIFYITSIAPNVVIKNAIFINGQRSAGSAIVIDEGANYFTIENCTFKNNEATVVGGAIYSRANNGMITNNLFENNVASSSGGAIRIEGGDSNTIVNNIFTGNKATGYLGGALNVLGHNNQIINNTFTQNTAGRDGGAISIEGSKLEEIGTKNVISYNVFTSNKASGCDEGSHGGAISMAGENCEISNNNFTNNHAATIGGAIRWNGANSNMGKLTGNRFEGNDAGSGGAIYIGGHGLTISKNTFNNNKATLGAGGTINIYGNWAIISDNEITKSTSEQSGGAIYINGKSAKLINNIISQCSAKNDGGAIYLNGASTTISGNKFISNTGQIGGAIFLKTKNAKIKNNEFTKNVAKSSGGAAYIIASKSTLSYNTFTKNVAQINSVGGAVRWSGDDASITKNTFTKNTAKNTGMAIYGSGENVQLAGNKYTPYQSNTQRWEQIKVRAATPTFVFKYTKTKKVIVTLKSVYKKALSNKKITLKVNGKTYKGYTNYKGQAVIKIYLNKKGLYKYTAKFSGDINYYSISQKGLIKIK